ncbi:MAG: transglycosylase domain-containing protein [Clostridia bacterium]|nr:transglycosylase domain-containing protein [Clostridia bacterium]
MKKKGRRLRILALIIFSGALLVAIIIGILGISIYKGINFESDERLFEASRGFASTTFYANASSDGEYEPTAIEISGSIRKIFYSNDEIGEYIKKGFIAVEDKKFYSHKGIDLKRTMLAAVNYIFGGDKVFGASTITQQVVKNVSGDNDVTIRRKLEEIIRAIHIEQNYSKDEILEVYLNVIPMSENIYCVGAAAKAYFGKEPNELSPAEAATLIGITNAPTAYNPYINPEACTKKRNVVLSVMRDDGIISEEEYTMAASSKLCVIDKENREDRIDSWFIETVIGDATVDLGRKYQMSESAARMMLLGGGYKVYTTINPDVQSMLEAYFENSDNFPREIKNGLNYAMAVTDTRTGYLVGIIGRVGKKSGNRLLNHAIAPHIPGSTLKPIALYAPLIDEGKINWASVFDDVPVEFIEAGGEYREYPKNSPAVYDGLTTVKDALRKSKNTVAVRLCKIRGAKNAFNSLRNDFGFDSLIEREGGLTDIAVAPMALGQLCRGVSLRKMTEGYSALAGEGIWRESISYLSITDYEGRLIIEKEQKQKNIFKASTARITTQMLMTVTEDGTGAAITLKNIVNTAGKTGTSGGSYEKSFIGYTPYFTAGIWCGYDGTGKAVSNLVKSHIEIWDEVMTDIHKDILASGEGRHFSTEDLCYLPYCKDSGRLYSDVCRLDPRGERLDYGYFSEDNRPEGLCDRHVAVKYDCETKAVASHGCPEENIVTVALLNISDRNFPKEIIVTDAEFVYRDIDGYTMRPIDYALPYFQYSLPEGVYVGRSKGKKQFNSNCYLHDE